MSHITSSQIPDWSAQAVVDWLFASGCKMDDNERFIRELGHCLNDCGADIGQLRIVLRTLHPQIVGVTSIWTRAGDGVERILAQRLVRESERFIGSPLQKVMQTLDSVRQRLEDLPEEAHGAYTELAGLGFTDYLALPIITAHGYASTFILVTNRPGGYCDNDIEQLHRIRDYLVPILEVQSMRHLSRSLMNTYVGKRTGEKVLAGMIERGDADVIHAALWFSDLRNFTQLTETLEASQVLGMLNDYFEFVAAAVDACGGEILRFIGDAMLIVFPIEGDRDAKAACMAALDAAIDAQTTLASLNHRRRRQGLPEIEFGVGLNVGEVIYGNVGAPERLDFTVMGPAVNRTARLESLTKELGHNILFSREFSEHIDEPVIAYEGRVMKGVAQPQTVFALDSD
jgi:adenylate cyclase